MLCTYAGKSWSLTVSACLYSILFFFSYRGRTVQYECERLWALSAVGTVAFSVLLFSGTRSWQWYKANQPVKIRQSVAGRRRRVCLLSLLLCWSKIAVKNLQGLLWTTSGLEHRMQFTTEESRQNKIIITPLRWVVYISAKLVLF